MKSEAFVTVTRELLRQALAQLEINRTNFYKGPSKSMCKCLAGGNDDAITALRAALKQPGGVTVSGWVPIEHPYPKDKHIDILLGDGSVLCSVLPQYDGDVWWGGAGTGEKFIDPKYSSVTHWRIHCDTEAPQPAQQEMCHCKERPASECSGEWEPGCDLGNNPKYVGVPNETS